MSAASDTAADKGSGFAQRARYLRPGAAFAAVFAGALAAGAALRLWELASRPGWQYDEGIYTRVAVNVMHGTLNEHITAGVPWQPFLFQPPFYFLALAKWFSLTGPSLAHARVLGALMAVATLGVLFALLWRLHGPGAALFAGIPVIFDGWLLYIQRVSYMENAVLLIIVIGLLAYQTALVRGSWPWFVVAGLVLGFAVAFKQTGAYILLAVALCWLILRRQHKGHLLLLGTAVAVFATYVAVMVRLYDLPGNDWYLQESLVQIRRVLALQSSGGTLTSPAAFVHLISAQYRVFLPSLLLALAACVLAVRRLWQCYRARDWQPARGNALLFAWLIAGVVVFGVSALRFPQYFELFLIPLYCFLWTEIYRWRWPGSRKAAAVALAAVAGLGSFYLRVLPLNDQVFAHVQRYAATAIPRDGLVVTEEAIGDLIQQPWCRVESAKPCVGSATYAITWQTYLQSSFKLGGPAFHHLMRGAVPVKSFTGFNGTATVWRLK